MPEDSSLKIELALKAAMLAHTALGLITCHGKMVAALTFKEMAERMESIRQTIVNMPND